MFEDLDVFYADFGTTVTRAGGGTFLGLLDIADQQAFDVALQGTHTLRYPATVALAHGEALTVAGVTYKVADRPQRINPLERRAQLTRA